MTAMAERPFSKAFAVWFRQLDRFDPASFHGIYWHWPESVMYPINSALQARKEKVDRSIFEFSSLQPITIHFDGSINKRKLQENRNFKMDLFFARPGDIVVAKIDLKNGAVGIVPEWENVVVTNHFAVYEPDRTIINPEYFLLIIQANFFKSYLWRNKVGAEGRKEVKLEFFENIKIPMPSLDVQKAIVTRWWTTEESAKQSEERVKQLEESIIIDALGEMGINITPQKKRAKFFINNWRDFERWGVQFNRWDWSLDTLLLCTKFPSNILSDVAYINPIVLKVLKLKDKITFVPMAAVSEVHGAIETPEERSYNEVRSGYTRFQENDVIWAKITPCMENGKCAVAKNLINGIGFGSTEFHVIRSKSDLLLMPEYLWVLLRLSYIRQAATRFFVGSAGQQRVPSEFLEGLRIPVPPLEMQKEIVRRVEVGRKIIRQEQESAAQIASDAEIEVERLILGLENV